MEPKILASLLDLKIHIYYALIFNNWRKTLIQCLLTKSIWGKYSTITCSIKPRFRRILLSKTFYYLLAQSSLNVSIQYMKLLSHYPVVNECIYQIKVNKIRILTHNHQICIWWCEKLFLKVYKNYWHNSMHEISRR